MGLLHLYGNHSSAFFGLAAASEQFLAPRGRGLITYRVVVALGGPLYAPQAVEEVTRSFLEFCTMHHWHVAFFQAYPDSLAVYRALKFSAFKIGEEAILSPQSFTLQRSERTRCSL